MEQSGLCTIGLQKIKRMIWSFIGINAIKQPGISLPLSGFFQDLFMQKYPVSLDSNSFGPKSGQTKCQALSGSKLERLFQSGVILDFLKANFEEKKNHEKFSSMQRVNINGCI